MVVAGHGPCVSSLVVVVVGGWLRGACRAEAGRPRAGAQNACGSPALGLGEGKGRLGLCWAFQSRGYGHTYGHWPQEGSGAEGHSPGRGSQSSFCSISSLPSC